MNLAYESIKWLHIRTSLPPFAFASTIHAILPETMKSGLSCLPWLLSALLFVSTAMPMSITLPTTRIAEGSSSTAVTRSSPTVTRSSPTVTRSSPAVTVTQSPSGVNPDPPPFDGKVVIDGGKDNSIVKVYNKLGAIIFRKEIPEAQRNLRLSSTKREWVLLRSVVGLDNVIEVNQFLHLRVNHETGGNNQLFWFDAGFLRNKAYPGKVVAMVPVDGVEPMAMDFGLELVDETEGNDGLYWVYNADKKTFENGYPLIKYVIEVKNGDYSIGNVVDVHELSGQDREKFQMIANPDARELEILDMSFDVDHAVVASTTVSLYRMTNRNNSPVSNTVKINQEEIQSTVSKKSFFWKNELAVSAGFTFDLAIPEVDADMSIHFGVKDTITVGSNSETKNTHVQKWSFETPITVPPYSEVKFNMAVQQGQASIPFTAIMRRGNDVWVETGMYEGVNFFGLDVSIDVNDLKLLLSKNDIFRVL